jgi:hypothetical protein
MSVTHAFQRERTQAGSRFAEASDRAPIPPFADMYIDHKAPPVKHLRAETMGRFICNTLSLPLSTSP